MKALYVLTETLLNDMGVEIDVFVSASTDYEALKEMAKELYKGGIHVTNQELATPLRDMERVCVFKVNDGVTTFEETPFGKWQFLPFAEEPVPFEDWIEEREREIFRYDHFKSLGKESDFVFQTLSFMSRASREMSLALTIAGQTEEIPVSYVALLREFSKGYNRIQEDIRKLDFEPDEDMSQIEGTVQRAAEELSDPPISFEEVIQRKLAPKADELGIRFKVKISHKDWGPDILIRIHHDHLRQKEAVSEFDDFVFETIVPIFANQVRYSYPKKL